MFVGHGGILAFCCGDEEMSAHGAKALHEGNYKGWVEEGVGLFTSSDENAGKLLCLLAKTYQWSTDSKS